MRVIFIIVSIFCAVKGCEDMLKWLFGGVAKKSERAAKEVVKEGSHNIYFTRSQLEFFQKSEI